MKVSTFLEYLLSTPKSFYVSANLLGFKRALRLPIVVRYNTKVLSLKGSVTILGGGRIWIGFGQVSEFNKKHNPSIIKLDGTIVFESSCWFGLGSKIISEPNSRLEVGKNFINTAKLTISNRGTIKIARDCLVSWNTWICDTDFHQITNMETGGKSNPNGQVKVGNHVWIASGSTLLKGTIIPDGCVVGYGSIINKEFSEYNCLLAGSPAQIKKKKVSWSR